MTWLGRDALGRVTDFSAESSTLDSDDPPDITVGGTAQTVSLLGPFSYVKPNTGGSGPSTDTGLTVPAGSTLIRAFAVFVEDTTTPGSPNTLTILAGESGPALQIYDLDFGYPDTGDANWAPEPGNDLAAFEQARSGIAVSDTNLYVVGGGSWHSGQIDIYALIASPS